MRIFILSCFLFATASALAAPKNLVRATLIADTTAIKPGEPFRVGVLLKIEPNWHIYWKNPGDAGMPTTIDFKLPDGFRAGPIEFPVPTRLVQPGDIVAYGYENEVMLLTTITPPEKIDESNITIAASVNWLVCEKVCIPGNANLNLTLPISADAKKDQSELFEKWSRQIPVAVKDSPDVVSDSEHVTGNQLSISIQWKNDVSSDIQWFPPAMPATTFNNLKITTKDKTTLVTATVDTLTGQPADAGSFESVVGYTISGKILGITVPVDINSTVRK
jgi:DsbC/DsbD-like thiol-disulfide interchange protein